MAVFVCLFLVWIGSAMGVVIWSASRLERALLARAQEGHWRWLPAVPACLALIALAFSLFFTAQNGGYFGDFLTVWTVCGGAVGSLVAMIWLVRILPERHKLAGLAALLYPVLLVAVWDIRDIYPKDIVVRCDLGRISEALELYREQHGSYPVQFNIYELERLLLIEHRERTSCHSEYPRRGLYAFNTLPYYTVNSTNAREGWVYQAEGDAFTVGYWYTPWLLPIRVCWLASGERQGQCGFNRWDVFADSS